LSRSIVQEIRSFTRPTPTTSPPLTDITTTPDDLPGEAGWEPLGGQQGTTTELQKSFPQRAQIRRMKVEAAPGRLTLRWGESNGREGGGDLVGQDDGSAAGRDIIVKSRCIEGEAQENPVASCCTYILSMAPF